jgi:TrmH family RNA methyltransferase
MERISSRQNPIVKRFRDLSRGDSGGEWILLDGEHLLKEALASGARVDVAAFIEGLAAGPLSTLAAQAEQAGAHVFTVTEQVLSAVSPVRQPSGVVAIARRREAAFDEVLERKPSLVLMLSAVQDPGNVGAIVRAAEACGATGIVAGNGTADPFGWKALRGGMGSTLRLPIAVGQSLAEAVARARAAGLRVFATAARNGTPLPKCDLRGPSAILLGGEGQGLPEELSALADDRVTIPMRPPVESLNVAVAAALVLYEASRQRS